MTNSPENSTNNDLVFVWKIPLIQPLGVQESLRTLLSADEIQRANRFVFPIHRDRFVVARGVLRRILGAYLSLEPNAIRFDYNRQGKPAVVRSAEMPPLCFNLSHSADLALCAVTADRAVGIDIEAMRPICDRDRMARRYFAQSENSSYQMLSPDEKPEGFLIRWTMKEAYIKAHGQGLSMPLDQFNISAEPDLTGFHRVRTIDPLENTRWGIKRLCPPPGYIAAIVAEGFDWNLEYRQWPNDL